MQKPAGFSLLELLMVVAIIGILTALSIPTYYQHIVHERRMEAEITLTKLAAALERYYLINNTYQNATLEKLGFNSSIADNRYQLAIQSVTASDFTLAAIPLAQQESDRECATLTLNSLGEKGISGSGNITNCW